jgi:ATP-dependent Clp protease ATP-binding subunit ClpC
MIKGSLPHYEKYHKVKYSNKNIQDILDLSEIYLSHKKFPDKAFDIVDHVGSRAKIKNDYCPEELKEIRDKFALAEGDTFDEKEMESFVQDYVKELVSFVDSEDNVARVTRDDILDVLEKKTGIPKKTIGESRKSFKVFKSKMKKEIFGQEECIDKVYNTLTCVKAGLNDPEKPLTNFLFVGPTSVGKTFTAKNIAKHFFGNSNAFLQLNMSEYQDKTGMSKLLGANAGYVGYEEGGILTDFVRDNPNSVILFDEIEKSEPKILDLLLHLLDEGYVSDNLNRRVNFNKCIIVLTTNIGHASASKRSVGFVDDNHEKEAYNNSLKKQLRPELLARVENTVIFNGLNDSIMANIVGSEISKLKLRLKTKNVTLSINKRVKDLVVSEIKLKKLNARDIKSLVVRMIQFPLADFMINNEGYEKISLKVVDKKVIIS